MDSETYDNNEVNKDSMANELNSKLLNPKRYAAYLESATKQKSSDTIYNPPNMRSSSYQGGRAPKLYEERVETALICFFHSVLACMKNTHCLTKAFIEEYDPKVITPANN